jgi:hypothetical protein
LNFTLQIQIIAASIEIFVPKSLLILFVNAALFLSAQKVKKERYPLEVKAQEAKNETKKYFNKFFDSYYCFIFILKYILPKEIAAPLIKFFNFGCAAKL